MPEVWAGALGEERALTTADGGTSLTSAAGYIQFPALSKPGDSKQGHLMFTPRNFASSATVVQVTLNPWLTILKTTNSMATRPTDYSIEAQDASTGTSVVMGTLDTVANGDWVLVGSHIPFGGFYVDVDSVNSVASVTVTISYWNGSAWTDTSDSDGTSAATHLAKDGAVTWTPSSLWIPSALSSIYQNITFDAYYKDIPMYWVRWEVNLAVGTAVTLDSVTSINRSSAIPEFLSGQEKEQKIKWGWGGYGCIAALTDTGTASLIANLAVEGVF